MGRRRQSHRLRKDSGRAEQSGLRRRRVRFGQSRRARDFALRRRRVWVRLAAAIPIVPRRSRGARAQASRASYFDASANVYHRLPPGDLAARRSGRRWRRQAHIHHARCDRQHVALRRLSRKRRQLGGCALSVCEYEV